jgi:hypothetical protein
VGYFVYLIIEIYAGGTINPVFRYIFAECSLKYGADMELTGRLVDIPACRALCIGS